MTSIIKVDNLQNQCGANIISESSNVITIGASGDTVTLAAGASQSGFGRSGSVNWDTTPKTSSPVTAVSGNGYFINTTSGAITVNLPAGVAGSIVAVSDYANTASTNNIIIDPNGSDKINGVNADARITTNGATITLVYVDATRGWKDVNDATLDTTGIPPFISATGGTITTSGCGNFKIHTFTGPGTFTVTNAGSPAGSTTVDYLVVAGGGAGGSNLSGGGGAGGFRNNFPSPTTAGLPVSVQAYPITVGGGGPVSPSPGVGGSGNPSIFSTITSAGGGGGGGGPSCVTSGNGGSGGGAPGYAPAPTAGGTGNTPPVSPPQGNNGGSGGGSGPNYPGGGGGGSAAVGGRNPTGSGTGSAGGAGTQLNIDGNNYYWAGGGGGGHYCQGGTGGAGGIGGGGGGGVCTPGTGGTGGGNAINSGANGLAGSPAGPGAVVAGGAGGVNSGGGGGGGGHAGGPGLGGAGGSGIVVIRYKFQ